MHNPTLDSRTLDFPDSNPSPPSSSSLSRTPAHGAASSAPSPLSSRSAPTHTVRPSGASMAPCRTRSTFQTHSSARAERKWTARTSVIFGEIVWKVEQRLSLYFLIVDSYNTDIIEWKIRWECLEWKMHWECDSRYQMRSGWVILAPRKHPPY